MSDGALARMRPDLSIGALARPSGNVRGGGSPGAWHTRAAWATMTGWLVMTARPRRRCCGPLCEVQENFRRQLDLMRKPGTPASATAGTETPAARRLSRFFRTVRIDLVSPVAWMVIGVPWRLRHPRRLTGLAIASEAPAVAHGVLRGARAVQRRRPRMAAGSALVAAGSIARLRAASAEPLR